MPSLAPALIGVVFGFCQNFYGISLSQWPRGLRRGSAARSPAEIVDSNPTGGMDICLVSVVCC